MTNFSWINEIPVPDDVTLATMFKPIITWQCLYDDDTAIKRVIKTINNHIGLRFEFAEGRMVGIIYHNLAECPALPTGVYGVRVPPVWAGFSDNRLKSCICKIATPAIFPDATFSLCLDADLDIKGTIAEIRVLFDLADRAGFVVTRHPDPTWTGEPMTPEQKKDYMSRPGMHRFTPLFICGAIARKHGHTHSERLTWTWISEFFKWPTREQPTLSAAVYETGISPLAAPQTFLSLANKNIRFGLTCLAVHNPHRQ